MELSCVAKIEDGIIAILESDRYIHSVLLDPKMWKGFILELDLPIKIEDFEKNFSIQGNDIVENHMKRLKRMAFYDNEIPFFFKRNSYIQGIQIISYSLTNP